MELKVLRKDRIQDSWGTCRSICEWEGSCEKEDIDKYLVNKEKAAYGWHLEITYKDEENKKYKGELSEYWD